MSSATGKHSRLLFFLLGHIAFSSSTFIAYRDSFGQNNDWRNEQEILKRWLTLAEDSDPHVRLRAARDFQQVPESDRDATIKELIKLTKDKDCDVRDAAATSLGKCSTNSNRLLASNVTEPLIELLDDKVLYVQESLIVALGEIGDVHWEIDKTVLRIKEKLSNSNSYLRRAAAAALGKFGRAASPAAADIAALLNDIDGRVRVAAETALLELGPNAATAVPTLANLVDDECEFVQSAAMRVLGSVGPMATDAIPALARRAADPNSEIRLQAITAIGKIGLLGADTVIAIARALHDRDPEIRQTADLAWYELKSTNIPSIKAMIAGMKTEDRALAIDELCSFGSPAVPALAELLKHNDPEVRRMAVKALGQIGPAAHDAVGSIAGLLHDSDWHIRSMAALALGQIGPAAKPSVASLSESLKDMEGDVRVSACDALGRIGPDAQPALPQLIERLRDRSPVARSAAAQALGRIGPAANAALPGLKMLEQDEKVYVRNAATTAKAAITSE